MIKTTSLAMTIGYGDVLRVVTDVYQASFKVVELLCVAVFWYLVFTGTATIIQRFIEHRYRLA